VFDTAELKHFYSHDANFCTSAGTSMVTTDVGQI